MEIDKLKFEDSDIYKEYKEEILKDKDRYKPVLLKVLEEDIITCKILEEIIELWEKEWKEEANTEIDKLKFKDSDIFEKYKEEIGKNKERYKPVLLKALEEDIITCKILEEIIELWEKEWKEELSIEIDKSKFKDSDIYKEYKEEILKDKERYKPVLLKVLEEDKINSNIKKEIIDIWEEEWKEELSIEIDKSKFKDSDIYKEYKEEILKDKERYKPVLLKVLEEDKINSNIKKEIIDIWEVEWKEELNIEIDKSKFKDSDIYKEYKEEILKDKDRYKPVLLKVLEEDKINSNIEEIIELWEKEWKEESNEYINKLKIKIDKPKFRDNYIFRNYKEEILKDKDRYKPVLLELLEKNQIDDDIYKEIIDIWEEEWKEKPNIYIDKLKFYYSSYDKIYLFKEYKEEISSDKDRYRPALVDIFEKNGYINFNIYKEIIDIWEKEWKEEANIYIDKLKFKDSNVFKEYKEEIGKDKDRYKPVLLELLEKNQISQYIYKNIVDIWEKEWKEEVNIYIDKLKFKDNNIFEEYKEEIGKDKDRYKLILSELLEKNQISQYIYENIVDIWEKEWKEKPNIYIDKLKFKDNNIFEEYKEEIGKDKDRYKLILSELLEKNQISQYIYENIVDIWEKEWKEKPNIYIDKLKFELFRTYKKEIRKNKEKYKPILLELLEQNKINCYIEEMIKLWEEEWKEEANIYIDKLKFKDSDIFKEYKEEIGKDKDRYKLILLELLEKNQISQYIYENIVDIWEKEWKEKPNIYIDKLKFELFRTYKEEIRKNKEKYKPILLELLEQNKINCYIEEIIKLWEEEWKEEVNIYIDKLKFKDSNIFKEYKEEIGKAKDRYKLVLLELLEKNQISQYIYENIVDMWEKVWKEEANIYVDKLKFHYYIFKEYKEEIGKAKDRYKPVLLELLKENKIDSDINKDIVEIWEKEWKNLPNVYIDKLKFTYNDIFKEYKDEISKDKERYKPILLDKYQIDDDIYKEIVKIWEKDWREEGKIIGKIKIMNIDNIEYFIENKDEIIKNREKYETTVRRCFVLNTYKEIKPILNSWGDSDIELLTKLVLKSTYETYNTLYSELKDELIENRDSIVENISKNYKTKLKDKVVKLFILSTAQTIDELEEFEFKSPIEFLEYLKDKKVPSEFMKRYIKLLEEYYPTEFNEFKKNLGEGLLEKFDGFSYENCIEYSKYSDILDNTYNYEDIMKFRVVIENGRYLNKKKISEVDIEYSKKEKIKIAYWGKYKNVKKLSKVDEYVEDILPKDKKYINYEIDDLGFNDKKERYFKYNDDNIVVKLKDRKLKIFNSSGTEIKRLLSTSEDFYTVRTLENIKELKAMIKNVYTDGDNGIKKEYCNDVLRDYDLWREIYIDNVMLQEYATNLIWEEVDSDNNIVGRFRYTQDGEFCDSNDDEYNINKENRIRLLSLDKVSNDEIERWREQFSDYEIVQPVPQLELYDIDYSDIDPDNIEISNNEIELGKLEKNDIGLELKFKDDEMYFEIKDILKIQLEDKIKWTKYKTLSKDTIVKISRIKLLNNSDYSLRMVKLLKNKLGI